jgi:hypothetical protein
MFQIKSALAMVIFYNTAFSNATIFQVVRNMYIHESMA